MGSWLGIALDTYKYFVNRQKMVRWVVFINDLIFWAVQGLLIFYVLLLVNEGVLRFYIFLALLCGFAIYQSLLRSIYMKILHFVVKLVVSVYRFIKQTMKLLIMNPIIAFVHIILTIVTGFFIFLWNLIIWSSQFIFKLCKILLAPVLWILKQFWRRFPNSFRLSVKRFMTTLAGFSMPIKNLYGRIYRTWMKFFHK
ncbi:spore cortex biosynthesis protein YabQ [Bacillus alveayuensis]|uniref:Spore cortex biosynthesis protein YabQ n=2 Tax=Aeribacillus alveayuensis TaxID=279215 RepID=A0ABT9VQY8_9BACI|nr:spore cortex biosynthesis protein YabQ [Bacillus alveayuensis]